MRVNQLGWKEEDDKDKETDFKEEVSERKSNECTRNGKKHAWIAERVES